MISQRPDTLSPAQLIDFLRDTNPVLAQELEATFAEQCRAAKREMQELEPELENLEALFEKKDPEYLLRIAPYAGFILLLSTLFFKYGPGENGQFETSVIVLFVLLNAAILAKLAEEISDLRNKAAKGKAQTFALSKLAEKTEVVLHSGANNTLDHAYANLSAEIKRAIHTTLKYQD